MPLPTSVPILSLLLAAGPGAAMLSCDKIRVDGFNFDLSHLAGPHSVLTSRYESIPKTHHNTTYTLDLCKPLQKSGKEKATEECPNGTRVCAITRLLRGDTNEVSDVVAIAGSLENVGGSQFEYQATRLKTSDSNSDSQKEGLRLVLMGGKHPLDGPLKERREQKAIIELLCDPDKKGTEGEWSTSEAEQATAFPPRRRAAADDGGKDGHDGDGHDTDGAESAIEHQLRKEGAALIWESYQAEKEADVLRLTWHTKYACEKRDGSEKPGEEEGGGDVSRHWGFFTWFIIVAFLGIAAYLIFGSWLNYNRYGARGWDLVPHGDAIRDIPYLLKDWTRRVLNTVQGTGSRGGYSAV